MTLITPPEDGSPIDPEIEELRASISEFRDDLRDLSEQVRSGEDNAVAVAGRLLLEIQRSLRQAKETEAKIERRRKQREGVVHDYAVDLDDARYQIGCRLGRLRQCCRADEIS